MQTPEEAKLGFANLSGLSPSDAGDEIFRIAQERDEEESALFASGISLRDAQARVRQNSGHAFPDETDVVELAALWIVDPTILDNQDDPLSLGLAVRLPENLKQ